MPTSRATSRWPVAVAVPLLLLAACARPVPEGTAAGQPPAELTRFYHQVLRFGPCDGYATTAADEKIFAADPRYECARLEVPLDYAHPDGPTGQIAMLRVPARGQSQGSLLLNSGGPGGAGMRSAAETARNLAQSAVTERFDLIGFDPRGVGASTPAVECFTPEQYVAGDTTTEFYLTAGVWTADDARRLADRCAERSGGADTLASVSSRDTARDMDVLRAALGEDRLNFLGQSYGTRIGLLYAEAFPRNVRALVLDAAVDPRAGADRKLSQFAGFQQSFLELAVDCAARPECPLGTDPAQATGRFQEIVRPLLDAPVVAPDGYRFGYSDAVDAVIGILYDPTAWQYFPRGVQQLRAGDPKFFRAVLALYSGRDADGRGSNQPSANYAISCMDEQRLSPEQAVDLRARIYQAAPFADPGRDLDGARDSCEAYPAQSKPTYPMPDRIEGLPPTLTISLTSDPTTPYEGAVRLAEMLGGSLLTVDGAGHTIAATGRNACVNHFVADYLTTLKTPAAGARCTT